MKILVVGNGGREHALVWKLARSPQVKRMWCAPGNGGTAQEKLVNGELVENVAISVCDVDGLCGFATGQKVNFVIVGPPEPLYLGLVDRLKKAGIRTFGPTQDGSQFGSSPAFARDFFTSAQIPIVDGDSFTSLNEALHFLQEIDGGLFNQAKLLNKWPRSNHLLYKRGSHRCGDKSFWSWGRFRY